MLLIGILINLTANPMNPMTKNPIPTAREMSMNSILISRSSRRARGDWEGAFSVWFCAPVEEECAVFNKVARDIQHFFHLVRHCHGWTRECDVVTLEISRRRKNRTAKG